MSGGGGSSSDGGGGNDMQVSGVEAAYSNEKGISTHTESKTQSKSTGSEAPEAIAVIAVVTLSGVSSPVL